MGQHRPKRRRPSAPDPHRVWWFVREAIRKILVFLLAVVVGFVILILAILPVIAFTWWLLKYAAAQ